MWWRGGVQRVCVRVGEGSRVKTRGLRGTTASALGTACAVVVAKERENFVSRLSLLHMPRVSIGWVCVCVRKVLVEKVVIVQLLVVSEGETANTSHW